jgi:hypothetical protein
VVEFVMRSSENRAIRQAVMQVAVGREAAGCWRWTLFRPDILNLPVWVLFRRRK